MAKYLDELKNSPSIKHAQFLKKKGWKIIKPKKARSNFQMIDEAGDIQFYGKTDEIDEFIKLLARSDADKVYSYKKVINYFNSSRARYRKNKILDNGDVLELSTYNKPPLCVDFSSTSKYIYGGKASKPGVVKIKLTGNDDKDF